MIYKSGQRSTFIISLRTSHTLTYRTKKKNIYIYEIKKEINQEITNIYIQSYIVKWNALVIYHILYKSHFHLWEKNEIKKEIFHEITNRYRVTLLESITLWILLYFVLICYHVDSTGNTHTSLTAHYVSKSRVNYLISNPHCPGMLHSEAGGTQSTKQSYSVLQKSETI